LSGSGGTERRDPFRRRGPPNSKAALLREDRPWVVREERQGGANGPTIPGSRSVVRLRAFRYDSSRGRRRRSINVSFRVDPSGDYGWTPLSRKRTLRSRSRSAASRRTAVATVNPDETGRAETVGGRCSRVFQKNEVSRRRRRRALVARRRRCGISVSFSFLRKNEQQLTFSPRLVFYQLRYQAGSRQPGDGLVRDAGFPAPSWASCRAGPRWTFGDGTSNRVGPRTARAPSPCFRTVWRE